MYRCENQSVERTAEERSLKGLSGVCTNQPSVPQTATTETMDPSDESLGYFQSSAVADWMHRLCESDIGH